ncbi:MAG: hypothetical protein Q9227_007655 [Pyrenula ochraceoflavens]
MQLSLFLIASLCARLNLAQETVLGAYIFSRHGDRTAKSTPPSSLTDLGYEEVFTSGTYFRNRYVASGATSKITGLNTDLFKMSQITASAPYDDVLMPSTQGFLQGLYPPVGRQLGSSALRNGTTIQAPLNGYQLIPIEEVQTGTGSENTAWLQGSSNCKNAIISSNKYFDSEEYQKLLSSTKNFYGSVLPMVNETFNSTQMSFKNAYSIFDLLNVANIHNATIPSNHLLTSDVLFQLRTLADNHEFNLAFNASEPIRAVAGATLAGQVVQALNETIIGKGKNKLNIQFGAYGNFQSFFGLAQLAKANPDFYGVPDYASTMTWELVTNASADPFPSADDISVRFLFHNHTTSSTSQPIAYPLFGQSQELLAWKDFVMGMNKFAITGQKAWCTACGNSTGVCAPTSFSNAASSSSQSSSSNSGSGGSGMSNAVAGVIGAMVTLGVILGIELLALFIGGLRVVSKKRLAGNDASPAGSTSKA